MINDSFKQHLQLEKITGDIAKLYRSVKSGKNCLVFSVTAAERAHIAWGLDSPFVYICDNRNQAARVLASLKEYLGDEVMPIYEREELISGVGNIAQSSNIARIKALYGLACGSIKGIVTTPEAAMGYFPLPKSVLSQVLNLNINIECDPIELSVKLTAMGYTMREVIENRGDFTLRGDILNIFPISADNPYRISFFGDTIEFIHQYDIDTMAKIDDAADNELLIFPLSEYIMDSKDGNRLIALAEKDIEKLSNDEAKRRANSLIEEAKLSFMGNSGSPSNYILPYYEDRTTIDAYLNKSSLIIYDEPKLIESKSLVYEEAFVKRCKSLSEEGEILPKHKHNIINSVKFKALFENYKRIGFALLSSGNRMFRTEEIFNLQSNPVSSYYMNYMGLFTDLKSYISLGFNVIISAGDNYSAEGLKSSLYEQSIFAAVCDDLPEKLGSVTITSQQLSNGFINKKAKFVVIGRDEVFRRRESVKKQQRKTQVFTMPKCGDYVVHEVHGIGLCAGIERIKTQGVEKDFLAINYAGSDRLYVPVDQLDKITRFSGSDNAPKLSKIGGGDFNKVKEKVKMSVKEMAFDLLELYKKRQNSRGFKYSEDTYWQREFEESFEFKETPDQLKSIAEIKADMERGIVMDRLLCGDVGYGKTEVALRAVFKTIMDGKQAAILAPTAILARQHYNTAMARFNDAKIKAVLLTRFQTKEEIEHNLKLIKSGKASLIVATHRMLSDKVEWQDLGLLVLDEEQRFGVEHKEKIKLKNGQINILTLSATPIPRTLNMALTGIRDISVLETPPVDRLPIETYVCELSDGLIQDAITRELARDGQVFYLHNRVEDIYSVAERIGKLVPEARIVVGHGQMGDAELENAIDIFYKKEANVLVATTIIENGIDLPDANTLIVSDADRIGLSALYQLRGRVGRSNKVAYAYFTTQHNKVLTEDAVKRLQAIMDFTDFGSGFKIAMRDLEIRGAGNVLGKEQHGHITKVGYDMYCRLLQEAVDEIADGTVARREKFNDGGCEMSVEINSYLDANYISNNNEKIKIYKEIAEISSETDRCGLIARLTETYGRPEAALVNLTEVAMIKNLAQSVGAKRVVINDKGAGIIFDGNLAHNREVIEASQRFYNKCVLADGVSPSLVFDVKGLAMNDKIEIIKKFLLSIVKKC